MCFEISNTSLVIMRHHGSQWCEELWDPEESLPTLSSTRFLGYREPTAHVTQVATHGSATTRQ